MNVQDILAIATLGLLGGGTVPKKRKEKKKETLNRCPKCGSRDFKWVNVGSHSNGDTWRCTCMKCDHEYTVVEECFFRIEEDE